MACQNFEQCAENARPAARMKKRPMSCPAPATQSHVPDVPCLQRKNDTAAKPDKNELFRRRVAGSPFRARLHSKSRRNFLLQRSPNLPDTPTRTLNRTQALSTAAKKNTRVTTLFGEKNSISSSFIHLNPFSDSRMMPYAVWDLLLRRLNWEAGNSQVA